MAVDLTPGQTVDLSELGAQPSLAHLGLGWNRREEKWYSLIGGEKTVPKDVDLDASAVLCNDYEVQEIVSFRNLVSSDGAIRHSGDNRSGLGEGEDEFILIDLNTVDPAIRHIYFVITAFKGRDLSDVDDAFVRIADDAAGREELARFALSTSSKKTALIMARLSRAKDGWALTALGEPAAGRIAEELSTEIGNRLGSLR